MFFGRSVAGIKDSGLDFNVSKTSCLRIGNSDQQNENYCGVKWVTDMKILGIFFKKYLNIEQINFQAKLLKIENKKKYRSGVEGS